MATPAPPLTTPQWFRPRHRPSHKYQPITSRRAVPPTHPERSSQSPLVKERHTPTVTNQSPVRRFQVPPLLAAARPPPARQPITRRRCGGNRRERPGTDRNRRGRGPVGGGPGSDWSLTARGRSAARITLRRAAVNAAAMMLPPAERALARSRHRPREEIGR